MLPRLLACGLMLLLLPVAAAFPTADEEVSIRYPADGSPAAVGTGRLAFEGDVRGGVLGAGSAGFARFAAIPRLDVVERGEGGAMRSETIRDVTLVVHEGSFVWRFASGGSLDTTGEAPYAMGLALPEAPIPSASGDPAGPGLLLAGDALGVAGRWSGEATELLALDATVSLLDAQGAALPGWSRREVNPGVRAAEADPARLDTIFAPSGPFAANVSHGLVGLAFGDGAEATLRVRPSESDRFEPTLAVLESAGAQLGYSDGVFAGASPLRALEDFSPMLNGATLLVPRPDDPDAAPTHSSVGGRDFEVGPITVLRSDDLSVAWREDEMRVQGQATVAVGRQGFAVEAPATLGFLPALSVALWVVAAAAAVWFFVRRPPAAEGSWTFRFVGWIAHALAFLLVFYLWDASFADTFGTSFFSVAREGVTPDSVPRMMLVLAIEMIPWGLAALFFALPVRIALGVALRYLGQGKTLKGFAKAGGLLSLAVFGPLHALWLFNVVLERVLPLLPANL